MRPPPSGVRRDAAGESRPDQGPAEGERTKLVRLRFRKRHRRSPGGESRCCPKTSCTGTALSRTRSSTLPQQQAPRRSRLPFDRGPAHRRRAWRRCFCREAISKVGLGSVAIDDPPSSLMPHGAAAAEILAVEKLPRHVAHLVVGHDGDHSHQVLRQRVGKVVQRVGISLTRLDFDRDR